MTLSESLTPPRSLYIYLYISLFYSVALSLTDYLSLPLSGLSVVRVRESSSQAGLVTLFND